MAKLTWPRTHRPPTIWRLAREGPAFQGPNRAPPRDFLTRQGNEVRTMAQRSIRTFTVLPHLPDRLKPLHKLAYNLWWCWNHGAIALFRRIDDEKFDALDNSPV